MTLKQLTTGSIILMFLFVFISLGMNSAVDQSIKFAVNTQDKTDEPVAKSQPLKAEVHQSGQGTANLMNTDNRLTFGGTEDKKNLITSLVEKGILQVYNTINPPETDQDDPVMSFSNLEDYQSYLEQNPLSQEDEALLNKYTDKSPIELLQSFCQDVKSPEYKKMIADIKDSYGNDPSSPAGLMKMFETTAMLCP